jgi:hypothetical protein
VYSKLGQSLLPSAVCFCRGPTAFHSLHTKKTSTVFTTFFRCSHRFSPLPLSPFPSPFSPLFPFPPLPLSFPLSSPLPSPSLTRPGDCDLQLHSRPYYASAGSGEERESRECVCTNITTHIRLLDTFSRPPMNPSQTQVSTTSSSRPSFPSK